MLPNRHILPIRGLRFSVTVSEMRAWCVHFARQKQKELGRTVFDQFSLRRVRPILLAILVVAGSGCQTLRLPSIDPTGNRLFTESTTPVVLPELPGYDRWSFLPEPAFAPPMSVPACDLDGQGPGYIIPSGGYGPCSSCGLGGCLEGCPVKKRLHKPYQDPIKNGTLRVDPEQTVAPVGSEVVLRAGLCGLDGYLVTNQPLEWTLSQQSRGHIVSVGHSSHSLYSLLPTAFYGNEARKYSGNYAVGRTTTKRETVTRGTKSEEDDFAMAKGENWLSVTSAESGVTNITVWAPNATNWDQRRRTVKIHWVDAEWQFPKPIVAAVGRPARLVTRVQRQSGAPAEAMKVRYEIVDDRAAFADGGAVQEVLVDANGEAAVELAQVGQQGGTIRVNMTLIRPPTSGSDLPDMILAKDSTTVTWAAPALDLEFTAGPSLVGRDDVAIYRLEASNPGQAQVTNAVVVLSVPAGMQLIKTEPQHTSFTPDGKLIWSLGNLAPAEVVQLEVELRAPNSNIDVNVFAEVNSDEGLKADARFATEVFTSNLKIDASHAPSVVQGRDVEMTINVTNTGAEPVNGVMLTAEYDERLGHDRGNANRRVGRLTPRDGRILGGETVSIVLRFRGDLVGKGCVTIDAADASGEHNASISRCVEVQSLSAPPASGNIRVKIDINGPSQMIVGQVDFYTIIITNPSDIPLTDIQITQQFPQELIPVANDAPIVRPGALGWSIARLDPKQSSTIDVEMKAVGASPGAKVEASVRSGQEEDFDLQNTRIVAAQNAPDRPPVNVQPANPNAAATPNTSTSGFGVRVVPLRVFEEVGQPIVFVVKIKSGNQAERDVKLEITLPPHVHVTLQPGEAGLRKVDRIRFTTIRTLRAGEKDIDYRFEVQSLIPGDVNITATLISARQATPLSDTQKVTVLKGG